MKKKILTAVLCAVLIIMPFVLTLTAVIGTPSQYSQSFFAGLKLKHERLSSLEEPKLVLIGGSNLAFGIDSELLEEYIGMPVVNYGLYAALGTKAMLDMAKPYINKGDIVIICPEQDEQTYSLYYNGLNMWYALDCDYSLFKDVGASNYDDLLAALPEFASAKLKAIENSAVSKSGIYALSSFNEYGDICVDRPYNILVDFGKSLEVELTPELVTDEFTDYLNSFAKDIKRRGAEVWFGFSPVNREAVVSDKEDISKFYMSLGQKLDFPIISNINDYLLDSGYFYDTNYHMNSVGMLHRTALIAEDINRELGVSDTSFLKFYEPPVRPDNWLEAQSGQDDESNAENFVFEKNQSGMSIVGLSESGLKAEKLTVPSMYDSYPVVEIASEAFSGSSCLKTLLIPEGSSIRKLSKRAFAGCPTLEFIEIEIEPTELSADSGLFDGASDNCMIYVNEELYAAYVTDYFWCAMTERIDIIN